MRALLLTTALLMAPLSALAHGGHKAPVVPPWQDASAWPDRVIVTLPESPQTSFAVTWRTDSIVTETIAQIAPATNDARFDLEAITVRANSEPLDPANPDIGGERFAAVWNTGLESAHFHSVVFRDLDPDTPYAYRVRGSKGAWSEWYQVQTAAEDAPVEFVYVGDAQNGVLSHWSRLIRSAYQHAPEADFILHAGDLVNRASRDFEWAEWFKAVGFIHGMIPAIPVAGNHEYARLGLGAEQTDRILSIHWRPQFTLPEVEGLPEDLQEVVYDVRYSEDIHIFVLSTQNSNLRAQARWLDGALRESDAKWKIVSMHHPVFSSGRGRDNQERREVLLPVLERHAVDLVLQGHDHTYARGVIAQTPERVSQSTEEGRVKTMFVNSVSGPKMYNFKETEWDEYADTGVDLVRKAENTQFFQIILDANDLEELRIF
ncbi:MAG: FN3 domain-containing metallophosphoesterase family protein, partial [Pseudomonadota bacterium]